MIAMRFIADAMLGKLARWLRLAGQDVIYIGDLHVPPEQQDDALIERAKSDNRALITCDVGLHRRAKRAGPESVFIRGSDVAEQLAQVSKQSGQDIRIDLRSSRCPMCNGEPSLVDKESIHDEVPAAVFEAHDEFWKCESCGKTYWEGAHWKTIIEMAERYEQMMR